MLSVAEENPSFVPTIESLNGARWSKSGSNSRGPVRGVSASLVFSGKGSPGWSVRNASLPALSYTGAICSAGPVATGLGVPPSTPTTQMSKLPPASGEVA